MNVLDYNKLNQDEQREYIRLINDFSAAKLSRDFSKSDKIRNELSEWQGGVSDDEFISMSKTGKYLWCSIFESQGDGGHRQKRISHRKQLSEGAA